MLEATCWNYWIVQNLSTTILGQLTVVKFVVCLFRNEILSIHKCETKMYVMF